MASRPLPLRKRRTREHIIADLSINYVERQALLSGFSVERPIRDYGVDLLLFTYTEEGEPEAGEIRIQVKSTDHLRTVRHGAVVTARIERAHVRSWLTQPMPVVLILYDAVKDRAYWLYVQAHFGGIRRFGLSGSSESIMVRIPVTQLLNPDSIRRFQIFRNAILEQHEDLRHDQR